jgi:hypothetical protein
LEPPGPEPSWSMITIRRVWAFAAAAARAKRSRELIGLSRRIMLKTE